MCSSQDYIYSSPDHYHKFWKVVQGLLIMIYQLLVWNMQNFVFDNRRPDQLFPTSEELPPFAWSTSQNKFGSKTFFLTITFYHFQKILSHKMSEIEKDFHRCGQACLKDSKCCSYEFSPTYKQCNLNKECLPTTKKFQDFLFCKKNPSSAGMNR